MDEFSLIKQYFEKPNKEAALKNTALAVGIGDDCAVLSVPPAMDLVFSLDTLVEGVHFPVDADAGHIAWRLMGAAISDLAAMGAEPNNFTLALTLPKLDEQWLSEFSQNLALAANTYNITLAGGDTTKGPLTLSAQVQGFVPKGAALMRKGAKKGDLICVTGSLGDSRAGLSLLLDDSLRVTGENIDKDYLLERFYKPQPRVSTGLLIRRYASSCIDISDGLLADLSHILTQSDVGAKINADSIPMSEALQAVAADEALDWALTGGEDFELCFSVPADLWPSLQKALIDHPVKVSTIGVITGEKEIQLGTKGQWQVIAADGFNHFKKGVS